MQPILTQLLARAIQSAGDTRSRLVTVVTELAQLHPVWLCPEADLTVVSNETMQELALAAGLSAERVLRLGLPIRSTFSSQETYPQDLLRRALGWPSALPTVLLVHGSEPVNPTWLLCQALARGSVPFHLALVTGHDERLRRRLAGLSWNGPVSLYGFVDDLPEMMLAADLLITKAGSTLVAEGLAAGLPMLLLRGAAVDAGNTAYVVGAGIGALCESPTQLVSVLNEWLRVGNPLLGQMAERARALAQPLAAERIARAVWHLHRPA